MRLGPILPADAERLLGLDWSGTGRDPAGFFIDVDEQPLRGPPSEAGWVELRREGGACQFLRPDNLCEVHARFGEAAKPVMCRVFPLEFRATQAGLVVGVRLGECVSAEQAGDGSPLDGQRDALRALHREGGMVSLGPPLLWLVDGALVTLTQLESLEERVLTEPALEPGGLALALRLLDAVEARAQAAPLPEVPPSSFAALFAEVRVMPGMSLALAHGAGLSAGALALEEQIVRSSVFAKDSALHPEIASGAALLVVHARLSRARARAVAASRGLAEIPAALLNHSWKEVASQGVRERLAELKIAPRAAARSLEERRLV